MPALGPEQWRVLSPYLDKALDLTPEERGPWLELLREENPSLAKDLQTLLKEHDALGAEEFLKTGAAARRIPAPLTGQIVGAYTLESPIGQGGMGTVWLARRSDGRFEGRAAVKFLNFGFLGGTSEKRFKREGSFLARLAHPNIAHLIDAGITPAGQPYLILEYIEGEEIDVYCNEQGLDIDGRIRLFLDVLAAVAHAHTNLIVHRDVKPSNVLVTGDGQVKLLDFGIAKLLEVEAGALSATKLTGEDERALTLAYAAPEQVTGSAVTTGTDVYALGLLLYKLLTGKHPAESVLRSPAQLMKAIIDTKPPRPSDALGPAIKLSRTLRGDLDTIVAKALKKDVAERYASATAFADDLRRYLGHEPISARPDTLVYRAKKFVRRNRLPVALVAAALIATVAGATATAIQARTARRERDFAIRQLSRVQTINDFNSIVLLDAAPWGKPVTIGDLLARAEELIESRGDMDNTQRAELLMSVAWQYDLDTHAGEAQRLIERAIPFARASPDPSTRARASCGLAQAVAVTARDYPTAERLVQEGLQVIPDARFALDRVYCLQVSSEVALADGHFREAQARAESAEQALLQAPFRPAMLEFENLVALAKSYFRQRRLGDALATCKQASALLGTQRPGDTGEAGGLFWVWTAAMLDSGRPLEAEPLLRRGIQIARRPSPGLTSNYTTLLMALGKLEEAATYAERAHAETHNPRLASWTLWVRATTYSRLGRLEQASQMVSEQEALLSSPTLSADSRSRLAHSKALLAMARGDMSAALDFANQAAAKEQERALRDSVPGTSLLQEVLVMRSGIQLALGHVEEAISDAQRELRILTEITPAGMLTTHLGNAYLALGRALQAQGKREEAQAAFRSAAKHLESALGADHPETRGARQLVEGAVQ